MKNLLKRITAVLLAFVISAGGIGFSAADVFAATEPTIRIGDNAPMTRDEFMAWREQQGIRHFRIEGSILPAEVFFSGNNGSAFRSGELNDRILNVYLIPGAVSNAVSVPSIIIEETPAEIQRDTSPVIFDDLTPVLFSDEELTAMMENVPNAGPFETRSAITLPNRKLTESELSDWIAEYNEMGASSAFELGVIREINRVRTQHGLNPLALDPALMMSARLKTQEFGDLQYYNHHSIVHGSPTGAARMFGFEGTVGESMTRIGSNGEPNLFTTPERIVGGMMASNRGHRELLLNPRLSTVGFGAFFSPNSRGANGDMTHMFYFVTKFGVFHH